MDYPPDWSNMDIILYQTTSERERINKDLSSSLPLSGYLRGECSVTNPSFNIEVTNPSDYNYCYIQDFGRYYYITNIVSVRTNIWRIDCDVDVLMSFKDAILNLDVIVSDISLGESPVSTYFSGDQWASTVRTKTDIINFPNGLLDNGEYILITSGGVAS